MPFKTGMPSRALALAGFLSVAACGGKSPEQLKQEYLQNGDAFAAKNQLREAVVEYRNALQQDARFGEARLKLADTYATLGDAANAYREYTRAADLLPGNAEAQLKAGRALLVAQQFEDAQTRAENVLQRDPRNVDAQILRANALAGLKRIEEAITDVEEAIKNDPERSLSYSTLASLQLRRGERGPAEAAYLKAVETDPKSIQARLAAANFFWATRRASEAEAHLKAALAIQPTDIIINRAMASLLLMSGRAPDAERYLETVARETPNGAGQLLLADYYGVTRQRQKARLVLDRLAENRDAALVSAAKLRMARLSEADRDFAAALQLVAQVLEKQPADPEALIVRTRLLVRTNRLEDALIAAKAAAQAAPDSARAFAVLGLAQRAKGEIANAISSYNQAAQLNPRDGATQLQLGQLHLAAGSLTEADQFAESAREALGGSSAAMLLVGRVKLRKGDLAAAERAFAALDAESRDDPAVMIELGRLQSAKKNPPAARTWFEKALAASPGHVDALTELTASDLEARRGDAAKARLEMAMRQHPSDARILTLAGRTYAATKDYDKAESSLRQAVLVDAGSSEAMGTLIELYMVRGRSDDALSELQTLAARRPNLVAPHMLMGTIYQRQNRHGEAKDAYRRALTIDPRAALPANNLAYLYARDNERLDEALQLAQMARARMPESADVADTLGWVYYRKGLPEQALPALKEAVERQPENPAFRYHLGLASVAGGDVRLARQMLESALKLSPEAPDAAAARSALAKLAALGS